MQHIFLTGLIREIISYKRNQSFQCRIHAKKENDNLLYHLHFMLVSLCNLIFFTSFCFEFNTIELRYLGITYQIPFKQMSYIQNYDIVFKSILDEQIRYINLNDFIRQLQKKIQQLLKNTTNTKIH